MLIRKSFIILISLLITSNLSYCIFVLYFSTLLKAPLSFQPELFILISNCLFIIAALFFWIQQKQNSLPKKILDTTLQPGDYSDAQLIRKIPNILCIKDHDGKWRQASPEYLDYLNIKGQHYAGLTDMQISLIPGCNAVELQKNYNLDKTAWQLKNPVNDARISSLSSGGTLSVDLTFTPVFDQKRNPHRLCISGQPLKAHKPEGAEEKITDREIADFELLTILFDSSHLSFAILDGALRITRINAEFSSFTGYSIDELRNQGISFIKNGKTDSSIESIILSYFQSQKFQLWSGDFNCKKTNGFKYTAKLQIKPLRNKTNSLNQFFVTLIDISQYKLNEKRILQIAHYDDLTG
ncbi:MAG: PAS domain S-box protein, partial [Methyloprofundus sp.]|nr:PAS domain S-box protein [Methyloprofundus sp.]